MGSALPRSVSRIRGCLPPAMPWGAPPALFLPLGARGYAWRNLELPKSPHQVSSLSPTRQPPLSVPCALQGPGWPLFPFCLRVSQDVSGRMFSLRVTLTSAVLSGCRVIRLAAVSVLGWRRLVRNSINPPVTDASRAQAPLPAVPL